MPPGALNPPSKLGQPPSSHDSLHRQSFPAEHDDELRQTRASKGLRKSQSIVLRARDVSARPESASRSARGRARGRGHNAHSETPSNEPQDSAIDQSSVEELNIKANVEELANKARIERELLWRMRAERAAKERCQRHYELLLDALTVEAMRQLQHAVADLDASLQRLVPERLQRLFKKTYEEGNRSPSTVGGIKFFNDEQWGPYFYGEDGVLHWPFPSDVPISRGGRKNDHSDTD